LKERRLAGRLLSVHGHQGRSWWREPLAAGTWSRDAAALSARRRDLARNSTSTASCSSPFDQWSALKHYANQRKIQIVGDIPIFVAHDSADVWSNQTLFN
jgi:4-alpha-glucanotransferase